MTLTPEKMLELAKQAHAQLPQARALAQHTWISKKQCLENLYISLINFYKPAQ